MKLINKKSALAFAGLIAATLVLTSCQPPAGAPGAASQSKPDANAQKVTVAKGSVSNQIVATGKVVANASAAVAFQRGGVVTEVLVKEGQQVKAGQPLVKLDTTDLTLTSKQQWASYLSAQAQYSQSIKGPTAVEVKSAQASIASAQSSIASAQASKTDLYAAPTESALLQARADLQNAEAELKQAQSSYDRRNSQDPAGIGASQESISLEKATNNYNKAKAAYDAKFEKPTTAKVASANSQISSANAQIESARKSLEALQPVTETVQQRAAQMEQAYVAWQQAEENLKNATVVAPFDGIVTAVNYDRGDYAGAGQAAVQVADFAVPIFEVDVDEADLGGVKVGQTAQVRLQTYPNQPINGKVQSISTFGTNAGAVVNYKVKLSLGKAEGAGDQPIVLINMSGTSEIVTAKKDDALVVPNDAITVDSQTKRYSVSLLKADGTTQKVEVQLGFRDADKTQIIGGVNAGDTLVITTQGVKTTNPGPGGN